MSVDNAMVWLRKFKLAWAFPVRRYDEGIFYRVEVHLKYENYVHVFNQLYHLEQDR